MFNPVTLLNILAALVVAITIHEFSHALAAYKLGDPTAKYMGRLTLNPLAHLDPLGSLMILMSALSGFGIGWGKPTPVSPRNLRPGPRLGMGIVALAGPLSNFTLATVLALVLRFVQPMPDKAFAIIAIVIVVNIGLTAFNLLPLPMLDGFHILMGIIASIRGRWAYDLGSQLQRIEPHGPMILLVLIMLSRFLPVSPLSLMLDPVLKPLGGIINSLAGIKIWIW